MSTLEPADFRRRLKNDYILTKRLASPALGRVKAYMSGTDARRGRESSPEEGEAGRASVYDVTYTFPIPISSTQTTDSVTVRFDLLSGGDYPFTPPMANVLTNPRPYSHHFARDSGWVCIGPGWEEAQGKYLFPQLIVHVMHLLNFDEPPLHEDPARYRSFNPEAVVWWLTTRHGRPFDATLEYPAIPSELTHGVAAPRVTVFRAIPEPAAFRPMGDGSRTPATQRITAGGFRPIQARRP